MSGQSGVAGLTDYNKWDKIASEIPDDPKPAQKGAHPEQNADGFVKGQDNIPDKKMLKEQLDNMDEELKLSDKARRRSSATLAPHRRGLRSACLSPRRRRSGWPSASRRRSFATCSTSTSRRSRTR